MYQDILREAEIYQMIMQEGHEEEYQQRLQDQRLTILRMVQAKFPKLARLAIEQTSHITDTDKLQDLIVYMGLSQTEHEARQYLEPDKKAPKYDYLSITYVLFTLPTKILRFLESGGPRRISSRKI